MLARFATILLLVALAVTARSCASSATAPSPQGTARAPTATAVPASIVTRGDPARRMVALTFDTDAGAGRVAEILAVLRREGVRATFAVRGLWAEEHRDLLLAITSAGHEVINATYHGESFTGASTGTPLLTAEQRALELSRTEVTVYHLSQRSTRPYFRPPYGDIDTGVQRDAADAAYRTIVLWTFDTNAVDDGTPSEIAARVIAAAAPGAIFALHAASGSQDAAALPTMISGLRAEGYEFGTVADVLAR
jgi:peptidoglycan/xylan/chitin deacetylase (PgdA/CDA1 family)